MKYTLIIILLLLSKASYSQKQLFLDSSGNLVAPIWNINPIHGLKALNDSTLGIADKAIDPIKINWKLWKVAGDIEIDSNGVLTFIAPVPPMPVRRADTTIYGNVSTRVFYIPWLTATDGAYNLYKNGVYISPPGAYTITPGRLTLVTGISSRDRITISSK